MGFVYAISNGRGAVKIGWTRDPVRRLSEINVSDSEKCTLLGYVRGTREDEAELHRLLKNYRLRGEWFTLSGAVAAFVEMLPKHMRVLRARQSTGIRARDNPIGRWRSENRITQGMMAEMLGVERTRLCRWETGTVSIPAQQLRAVASLTGIPIEQLIPKAEQSA